MNITMSLFFISVKYFPLHTTNSTADMYIQWHLNINSVQEYSNNRIKKTLYMQSNHNELSCLSSCCHFKLSISI